MKFLFDFFPVLLFFVTFKLYEDPKEGMMAATAVIMVHNHPSGDPTPSKADIAMTHELRDIGNGLGIRLHDHVIVARGGHTSFKEMGLL